ncbi:hypothetical protein [Mucilaginibacter sp. BT774]|uniref:hypothetical protein n=1 Tax=Mucilaginibacter sp. BT774 TaxID=3062276 RepID=UPI0026743F6B|nr:hypothetical protein [Mucilaginibacter sp. BT774]MDO3627912.1 hypothetical protein [Mucilaginibacter sp. BT774]
MKTLSLMILLAVASVSVAQQKSKTHYYNPIETAQWVLPNSNGVSSSMQTYKGSKALIIKKSFNNYKFGAIAYPKDLNFTDGEIELDMASSNGQEYLGLAFHIQDAHHYQTLYFRPASTGTINAIQYMPEKKEDFNWWDYEAEKYQAKATLPATDWFHIKAVVKGRELKVYMNHAATPSMVYKDLDPDLKQGSVGYWFGNSLSCAYKNLTIKTY